MRIIPENLRERALGMLEAECTTAEVAARVGASVQSIRSLRRRFAQTGSTRDLPRSGRPRVTSRAQDRYILNQHLRDRFRTATATAAVTPGTHNNRISAQTVRNRLAESGLHGRRPYVGSVLSRRHRNNREQWALRHINWTRQRWRTVLFTDESRFVLSRADGRVRLYRRRNERYADCCVLQRDRFGGGGSVMVWGGIAYGYRTPFVVIDGNLNAQNTGKTFLGPHVVPLLQTHNVITTLQQDNATSHVARVNLEYLRNHNVDFIDDWPSKSPDLNPIKHLWDNLDRRVRRRLNPPNNVNELRAALLEEWNNIPQADINKLVLSMRRRCQAVSIAHGGHTRY